MPVNDNNQNLVKRERTQWHLILTKELLVELYINQAKSTNKISKEFGYPKSSILKALKKHGIERRQWKTILNNRPKYKNIQNKKFGKLTAISLHGRDYHGRAEWLCQCECGNQKVIIGQSLLSGHTKSCGCLEQELKQIRANKSKYFDISFNKFKQIQYSAQKREIEFNITIEDAWAQFEKQGKICALTGEQLKIGPKGNASLDRIDNRRGYLVDNIQWVTKLVNLMKNKFDEHEFIEVCYKVYYYQEKLCLLKNTDGAKNPIPSLKLEN